MATDGSAAEVLRLLRSLETAGTPALQVRPDASVAGWAGAAGMIVLFILALSWPAAAGLLARSAEAANAVTFVFIRHRVSQSA